MFLASFERPIYSQLAVYRACKWLQWLGSPTLLLLGSLGNCLSAWLLRGRSRRSGTHNYLLALAVADQVALLSGLVRSWLSSLIGLDYATVSSGSCLCLHFLSSASTHTSVALTAAVTVERVSVLRRRRPSVRTAVSRARRIVVALTAACALINAPWFFLLDVYRFDWNATASASPSANDSYLICDIRPDLLRTLKLPLAWLDCSLYSLIPMAIILCCNVFIVRKLRASRRTSGGIGSCRRGFNSDTPAADCRELRALRLASDASSSFAGRCRLTVATPATAAVAVAAPISADALLLRALNRSVGQVTLVLLLVSCFFVVTSLPITVLKVLTSLSSLVSADRNNDPGFYANYHLAQTCTELLMYANHSANFFLYCLADGRFRRSLRRRMARLRARTVGLLARRRQLRRRQEREWELRAQQD